MSKINELEIRFSHKYKDYYKDLKKHFIKNKGNDGLCWHDYCYAPMAATIAMITNGDANPILTDSVLQESCMMAAFSGWKTNKKNTVKIDEFTLRKILLSEYNEPIINQLNIFNKIGYGTFLEFKIDILENIFDIDMEGVLLHIEHDVNADRLELRANLVTKDKTTRSFVLHLLDERTLSECINDTLSFTSDNIESIVKDKSIIQLDALRVKNELNNSEKIYYLNYIVFAYILSLI